MFVLASVIAGAAGGVVAIFFWKGARYGIGAWGGFALALWIQCFQNGGVIKPIGFRWILYIVLAVVGFTLCTIPKIHYHVLLISTAFVGSSAFVLGVDCFTTAGLKEFYIWNVGFSSLFPKFTTNGIQFPVSQTMQIELGLIGAISLMGMAVQLRIMRILRRKLREIAEEARRQDEEAELQAATRFADLKQERETWEKDHPPLGKHGQDSTVSSLPLLKDREGSSSPTTLAEEGRPRHMSMLSDFKVAPGPVADDESRRSRLMQNPGALPTLDLGLGIQDDVPALFFSEEEKDKAKLKGMTIQELEDLKRKEELLAEIQNIRKSIEVLKEPPSPPNRSRRPSLSSRRTLSIDASTVLLQPTPHVRPPRETAPRARVNSMELTNITSRSPPLGAIGESISRPTSVPLQDADWDAYIQERKLLQPPSGVTPPIIPSSSTRVPMSSAVQDALDKRKRRESALAGSGGSGTGGSLGDDDMDDVPLAKIASNRADKRQSGLAGVTGFGNPGYTPANKDTEPPVTILPPRRAPAGNIIAPVPRQGATSKAPIVKTFEELNERHREKMRNLQEPVTRAERESADVRDAKERWERAKKAERESMRKKQAGKVAAIGKERKQQGLGSRKKDEPTGRRDPKRHSRSLSADRLGPGGSSSKRLSVLKVEDWQKYQASTGGKGSDDTSASREVGEFGRRRDSAVPFPGQSPGQNQSQSQKQHRKSGGYFT